MLKDWRWKTKSDKVLVSLADATGGYGVEISFSESEVFRLAFEAWPADFCMPGYPDLLDTKRISLLIVATSQLRKEGWIVRYAGRYRLTMEGLERANVVRGKPDDKVEFLAQLSARRGAKSRSRSQACARQQSAA